MEEEWLPVMTKKTPFILSVYYKLKCTQGSWWSDCEWRIMLHQKLKCRIYIFSLYKCISRKGDTDRTCSHGIYRLFILWYIWYTDRTFSWKSVETMDKNWIIDEKISTQVRNGCLFAVTQSPSRSCRSLGFNFTLTSSMLTSRNSFPFSELAYWLS